MLFALAPSLFFSDFVSSAEMEALKQFPADQLNPLLDNLREVRRSIFTSDCWRSLVVIVAGTLCLLLYQARKIKTPYLIGALILLCLVDMWTVNKRYLYDDMFVSKMVKETPPQMTSADEAILQDKSLDYRVLNFATNTFNENETSFYHKSVGGYHAAKLRRYQEMIEAYIMPQMQAAMKTVAEAGGNFAEVKGDSIYPVINMLNTKYFIFPLQGGDVTPLQNPYAYGNAWYVDKVEYAANANEEIDKVGQCDLRHVAVADNSFKAVLGESVSQDSTARVTITDYQPNHLTYTAESEKGGVIVFSEIYYPEWTATIDGKPAEVGRVNYILRALNVQPGKHEIVLDFHPASVASTETVAYAALAILLLTLIGGAVIKWRRRQNVDKA